MLVSRSGKETKSPLGKKFTLLTFYINVFISELEFLKSLWGLGTEEE
jgi:hypothetical protein